MFYQVGTIIWRVLFLGYEITITWWVKLWLLIVQCHTIFLLISSVKIFSYLQNIEHNINNTMLSCIQGFRLLKWNRICKANQCVDIYYTIYPVHSFVIILLYIILYMQYLKILQKLRNKLSMLITTTWRLIVWL